MRLDNLRKKIDNIDKNITLLLNDRAMLVQEIGEFKNNAKKDIYVPHRESQIYSNILKVNKGPLSDKALMSIYREIMSSSRALEKDLNIAYLGPEATFTHMAALKKFGVDVAYHSCISITDVFKEVETRRCDYGVVPVENSTEGIISHTLDMFINSDLKICSEMMMGITHNLIGKGSIISVKRVYSNPNVLGQCRHWLEAHLHNAELVEVPTTSKASEIASKERNSSAIASILAAEKYKLNIIAKNIEDNPNNVTRFLIIGENMPSSTGHDKTSIMLSVKDRIGALHDMLVPFKKAKVNLTKIESRPSRRKAWEYYFFIDMTGHCEDKNVKKALNELEKQAAYLKVLGSYPVGK